MNCAPVWQASHLAGVEAGERFRAPRILCLWYLLSVACRMLLVHDASSVGFPEEDGHQTRRCVPFKSIHHSASG